MDPRNPESIVNSQIIDECEAWYQAHFGFKGLPLQRKQIVFRSKRARWFSGFYVNKPQFIKSLFFSLVLSALISAGALFYSGWDTFLFLLLLFTVIGFPYCSLILRAKKIVVYSTQREETCQILIHELAHAYHNSNIFRTFIHFWLDILLFPFCLSYGEGIAVWVEKEYCESKGIPFDLGGYPLKYRLSYKVIAFIEKLFGRKTVVFLLKWL